jgi:lysophospholipase L1-like esterase
LASAVLMLCLLTGASNEVLQDGDRVVFLGDSITVLHTWTRLVEVAVRLRHPDWQLTFVNAGVGGNTAEDALERLDVDVLAQRPTVVFLNFGMNDASYPDGSAGAAFEKNMVTLLDRLADAQVRQVVWLDTTPYDTSVGAGNAFNRRRVARIAELVEFARVTAEARHLLGVPVNDAVTRAIATWRAGKRAENLIPDRIHPGPHLHAVMASKVLEVLGVDLSASRVKASLEGPTVRLVGRDGVDWTQDRPLTLEVPTVKAPLPFVLPLADAKLLDAPALLSQASLVFSMTGLPSRQRFLVKAGTAEVGRFTGAQLASGVDLLQTATARVAPGPERADLAVCDSMAGNPWANDVSCLFNLLFGKDQLRIAMRHEKTRGLPDAVPGYLERLDALHGEWLAAVEADVAQRVKTLVARPHLVVIEPERAVDAGR